MCGYYSTEESRKQERRTRSAKIFFRWSTKLEKALAKKRSLAYNIWAVDFFATVAQLVEQLIRNQQVAGSSPASSSRKGTCFCRCFFFFLLVVLYFDKNKNSLCQRQRLFMERMTRLELATSTLARWRSTGWATSATAREIIAKRLAFVKKKLKFFVFLFWAFKRPGVSEFG